MTEQKPKERELLQVAMDPETMMFMANALAYTNAMLAGDLNGQMICAT